MTHIYPEDLRTLPLSFSLPLSIRHTNSLSLSLPKKYLGQGNLDFLPWDKEYRVVLEEKQTLIDRLKFDPDITKKTH